MDVKQVLHMNGGEGRTSYSENSLLQRSVIWKVKPIIEEAVLNLYSNTFPQCLRFADLGCSSGPNTLLVISQIIDTCHRLNRQSPEFLVFLNDLPVNDFNMIFKSLPDFYKKLEKKNLGRCFISGMPGSFYGRLFPRETLHFVHSSFSLHWLSQIPQGLESEAGAPLNKRNIYLATTSPPKVVKSYQEQFQRDFSSFLRLRSEEIIPGGRMVLTFMGRRNDDLSNHENCTPWKFLVWALNDMVTEGLVEEAKLDSFNVPVYMASAKEIKNLIQAEGSFNLDRLETLEVNWDGSTDDVNKDCKVDQFSMGQKIATALRATVESLLVSHFGEEMMNDLFRRCTEKAAEFLMRKESKCISIVVSLTKKVPRSPV